MNYRLLLKDRCWYIAAALAQTPQEIGKKAAKKKRRNECGAFSKGVVSSPDQIQ